MSTARNNPLRGYGRDMIAGLTVSIVTLSLGAAFGQLSGRGVLIGMLSAAVIPVVTSLLGGTRVQCSGPTGPMTAAFAAIMLTVTASFGPTGQAEGMMNLVLLLPATLIAILAMTVVAHAGNLPVEFAIAERSLRSMGDIAGLLAQNDSSGWPWHLTIVALPLALQLASVAYMDTLLTSLIIDKMRRERSARNRELGAQGMAMGVVALFGGIPGAQATERSVLMIREGARTRLAGVSTGLIALLVIILFQDAITLIPKAVFAGILLKIGYDVFDWQPLRMWLQRRVFGRKEVHTHVSTLEIAIILTIAAVTALIDVTLAVLAGTAAFYALRRVPSLRRRLMDLVPVKETEGVTDEP